MELSANRVMNKSFTVQSPTSFLSCLHGAEYFTYEILKLLQTPISGNASSDEMTMF